MGITISAFAFVTGVLIWTIGSGRGFALYGEMERSKEPLTYWVALLVFAALSGLCFGILMTRVLDLNAHAIVTAQHFKGSARSL